MADELTFPRPDGLSDEEWSQLTIDLEAYADQRRARLLASKAFAPHVIKHKPKDGADQLFDCPDCTRGLVSVMDALICYDVWRLTIDLHKLKWTSHDVIACGRS